VVFHQIRTHHPKIPPPSLLAGAFHQRAAVSLFGRCIPSPRHGLFVRPAHLIAAPHSLSFAGAFTADPPIWCCGSAGASFRRTAFFSFAGAFAADPPIWCCCSAGESHRRAAFSFVCRRIRRRSTDLVLLFGRRISSPRRILFRLPAHLPPIHRFGVVPFGRRIGRRSTNLVLLRLAGAFPAEPPPIRRCFTRPAHSPPIRSLRLPAHSPPTHRFGIAPFGWRIPSPDYHCPFFAGASPRRLLFLAGASPRRATIAYLGWGIPSPCLHCLSWSAHPIAAPPYHISAGASHCRTSIAYLSVSALTRCRTARRNIKVVTFFTPAPQPHQY